MVRAGFGFEDDGIWHEGERGMPRAGGNIGAEGDVFSALCRTIRRVTSAEFYLLNDSAGVIKMIKPMSPRSTTKVSSLLGSKCRCGAM